MTLKKSLFAGIAMTLALSFSAGSAFAGIDGNWKRKGGQAVKIWHCGPGKKLLCAQSGSTRMFNGIKASGRNAWKGSMKHPDMPGFMTFNGTVKYSGSSVKVQGCMVGGSMCQSETWRK